MFPSTVVPFCISLGPQVPSWSFLSVLVAPWCDITGKIQSIHGEFNPCFSRNRDGSGGLEHFLFLEKLETKNPNSYFSKTMVEWFKWIVYQIFGSVFLWTVIYPWFKRLLTWWFKTIFDDLNLEMFIIFDSADICRYPSYIPLLSHLNPYEIAMFV